ncbi:MAG: SDR family oxidoreductase [Anaerolineaceae bacterium]
MKDYIGKLILITGGSSGIGLALAEGLFKAGASVFILARDQKRLDDALTLIGSHRVDDTQQLGTISVDVTDYDLLSEKLTAFMRTTGVPDIVFNSAGVARPGYVEMLDPEIFRWTMNINFHGTVNVNQVLLPELITRGSGHIINFSSLAGVLGVFGYTAYSGSKFAVRGYSDALRAELKPKGIRVSVVFPPDTDTPQLAWEDQYKPFETRVIAGSDKPMSASKVAHVVLEDVKKGKYNIVPGTEAKVLYFLATRLGGAIYPIMDMLVKDAIRKKNSQNGSSSK